MTAKTEYEQLSLFHRRSVAMRCADGQAISLEEPDAWMLKIVPQGEHAAFADGRPLMLVPVHLEIDQVREGHRYHHYAIGEQVYAGIFVG